MATFSKTLHVFFRIEFWKTNEKTSSSTRQHRYVDRTQTGLEVAINGPLRSVGRSVRYVRCCCLCSGSTGPRCRSHPFWRRHKSICSSLTTLTCVHPSKRNPNCTFIRPIHITIDRMAYGRAWSSTMAIRSSTYIWISVSLYYWEAALLHRVLLVGTTRILQRVFQQGPQKLDI